jgi:hypothetical protein
MWTRGDSDIDSREDRREALEDIDCDYSGERRFQWILKYVFDTQLMPALKYFGQTEGHMDVPRRYVLNEEQCRTAGLPEHIKEFPSWGTC